MNRLLVIESILGRRRTEKWGPRTIDLDLLLYADRIIDTPGLHVPHPRMHERLFVLQPLAEIAPTAIHPETRQTISQMLESLRKQSV
jgi:2-amino-4-hydroxy-6-hydroxymethyldihydropteridine diphosphokinase